MRDLGFSFAARMGTMVLSIANQSALAWFLGSAERGAFAVASIYANMLGVIFIFGIDQAGQYYVASGKLPRAEGTRATLATGVMLSVLAVVTGGLLLGMDIEYFSKAPPEAFLIALALVPFLILNVCTSMIMMAFRLFRDLAIVSIGAAVIQVLSIGLFVVALGMGVDGALWCSVVSGFVQLVWSVRILYRCGALESVRVRWADFYALLSYGARTYVGSITVTVNVQVGTVLMAFYAGQEEIGFFAVAVDLMTRVILLPDLVAQVVQPRVASDARGRPELVARTARMVWLISSGVVLAILFTSWWTIPLLFSPEFNPIIPLLWILGPGVMARCAAKALVPFLNGTNRPGVFSIAALLGIIVNVVLIQVLFPASRLAGASWALSISFLLSSLVLVLAFRKYSGLTLAQTWMPRRADYEQLINGVKGWRARFKSRAQ